MLQPNAESTILLLFHYNLENTFQNVRFKSWNNTLCSATIAFWCMSECSSDRLEHPLSVYVNIYIRPIFYYRMHS